MAEDQVSRREEFKKQRAKDLKFVQSERAKIRKYRGLPVPLPGDTRLALRFLAEKKRKERYKGEGTIDPVTQIFSRKVFDLQFAQEHAISKREGTPLGIQLGDLRQLKPINDTFGHAAGDTFLHIVAQTMQKNTRESDVLCRTGGDEFGLILPKVESVRDQDGKLSAKDGVVHAALRLLQSLHEAKIRYKNIELRPPHLDIGATLVYPEDTEEITYVRADQASYLAKHQTHYGELAVVVATVDESGDIFEIARLSSTGAIEYQRIANEAEILARKPA